MGAERRRVTAFVLAVVVLAVVNGATAGRVLLSHGRWSLATPLGEAAGPFLVVDDHGAATWRCEIAVAESGGWPDRQDLMRRQGRGWTITSTPDGSFVQPWDGPWRELGGSAARSLGELIGRWLAGDRSASGASGTRPDRWRPVEAWRPCPVVLREWTGLPADWRPVDDGPATGGALRRRLVARGRGRGGDGLVLDLRWMGDDLVATTARWPGRIALRRTGNESAELPVEAYLPLWPLAEFLP